MFAKSLLVTLLFTLSTCLSPLSGYNAALDSFVDLGQQAATWYEEGTLPDRPAADLAWLDQHWQEYDSYVIGSSWTSSLPTQKLNQYMNASFYNMAWYGGNLTDHRNTALYLLEHYQVKNLILSIDPQNTDLFNIRSTPIKGSSYQNTDRYATFHVYEAVKAISDLKTLCDNRGVNLMVLAEPFHDGDFSRYDTENMRLFWRELAQITDFYDFWGEGSVTSDPFFRVNLGEMMLAYLFHDPSVSLPDGFGHLTTADTVNARLAQVYTAQVPILMYHHFTVDPAEVTEVTAYIEDFRIQIAALAQSGWTAVSYQDLLNYVNYGTPLPAKPILITMDDGYQSNLDLALPILEEYGFRTTISVIGCSVGKSTYKDTDSPIYPHFSLESALPYVEAGILDVQTHSYDMHQVMELDGEDCRQGVLRMAGESVEDYTATFTADFLRAKEQLEVLPGVDPLMVFTYPYGLWDNLSEEVLQGLGFRITATTDLGVSVLTKGDPLSLYHLKRIDVLGGMTAQDLMATLASQLAQ